MKVNLAHFCFSILLTANSVASAQAAIPSISAIEKLAKETVSKKIQVPAAARVEIEPQSLDSRLLLPDCASELTVEMATDREISRNNTLKVSCDVAEQAYPWQIYMSVRVNISFPVIVPNETLAQGTTLTQSNLSTRYIDQFSLNGQQFDDIAPLIGAKVKRRVTKDYPIFSSNVCFVCKGDQVSIVASSENFQIKTVGIAEADGNLGEQIRVKNARSNKIIDALVTKVGEVRVNM
ncbi:flagellar basal body P-ring formation chaperone FlgA [Shewanella sp. C32]|uniref:Flagella basal body P-ring formation protein FlgA n=1 Tax=Shewanella electrica TaxID=515560 RepID=A0ABT2FJD6_9GAMM|nr:flagellar basal body P-ring formation chaperone FlgA [Shewanella electrica]MCH1924546.1 flagellar basal body P-ring formation protein FlgA [Shewanella electrica]MCS4556447.1 flagellar basal body P-ring formation chaperone FlgA [Shewanella electrica]